MQGFLLVAIGGALGAIGRHGTGLAMTSLLGKGFPWATLLVNVLGSLILGMLLTASEQAEVSPEVKLLVGTGLCGALTTFSTFSVETLGLMQKGSTGLALGNVGLNMALGLGARLGGDVGC